jgi:hypothetical protein
MTRIQLLSFDLRMILACAGLLVTGPPLLAQTPHTPPPKVAYASILNRLALCDSALRHGVAYCNTTIIRSSACARVLWRNSYHILALHQSIERRPVGHEDCYFVV